MVTRVKGAVGPRASEVYLSSGLSVEEAIEQSAGASSAFDTLQDLLAATPELGQIVQTRGYNNPGDGGANTYEIVAASTGTPDGGSFINLPTSGLQARGLFIDGTYNVKQFGATGNGSTNDSPAIQACVDFVEDGDEIYFPAPEVSYRLNSGISVGKRISLVGSQSKFTTSVNITMFSLTEPNINFEGFVLEGDRTFGQTGVYVKGDWIKVRDVTITLTYNGIEVDGGVWHRIEHIRGRNIANFVLDIGNVVGTVVDDFRYDTDVGTYSQPDTGLRLYGEGCVFSDMDFIHAGAACYIFTNSSRNSTWNFFNACSFDTSLYGVRVGNIDNTKEVKGLMFDQCWFASHSEAGVLLDGDYNTDGISFKGCYFVNNGRGGLVVEKATNNVEVNGCTFASNSMASLGAYSHIKHDSLGTVNLIGNSFTSWGIHTSNNSAAIERTANGSYLIIDSCYSAPEFNTQGFADTSTNPVDLGSNYGNLPSGAGGGGGGEGGSILNTTDLQTGNINLTSDASINTIRAQSTTRSGISGTTTSASNYGGVFSNTAGGAGLRVDQGDAQFAGNAQVDNNLGVSGTTTLSGSVGGTGFINSVDNRVSYETLNNNGDVGGGSNQVARGSHNHSKSDINQFQDFRMFGTQITTNGSGRATINHTLGVQPSVAICGTIGGADSIIQAVSVSSSSVTVEVRDVTGGGALKPNSTHIVYMIVAVPPPV